jgi:hypothetical protein
MRANSIGVIVIAALAARSIPRTHARARWVLMRYAVTSNLSNFARRYERTTQAPGSTSN